MYKLDDMVEAETVSEFATMVTVADLPREYWLHNVCV